MAEAGRDQNNVSTIVGVSSADGSVTIPVEVDSVTEELIFEAAEIAAQGAVTNREIAYRDENHVPVMIGVSSSDNETIVMPVCSPDGYLRFELI